MINSENAYLALYERWGKFNNRIVPISTHGLGIFVKGDNISVKDAKDKLGNKINSVQLYSDCLDSSIVIGQIQSDNNSSEPADPNIVDNETINSTYDKNLGLISLSELTDKEQLSPSDIADLLEAFVNNHPEFNLLVDAKGPISSALMMQINDYRESNNINSPDKIYNALRKRIDVLENHIAEISKKYNRLYQMVNNLISNLHISDIKMNDLVDPMNDRYEEQQDIKPAENLEEEIIDLDFPVEEDILEKDTSEEEYHKTR